MIEKRAVKKTYLPFHSSKTDGTGHDGHHVQIYQELHCQSEAAYFHLSILQSVHCFHTVIFKMLKASVTRVKRNETSESINGEIYNT
jgi:hypothetical protein